MTQTQSIWRGILLLTIVCVPQIVAAQLGEVDTFFGNLIGFLSGIVVPILLAVSLVAFLWGEVSYFILGGADERKREQGKAFVLYSIIGFVLMVSIFGITNFLASGIMSGTNEEQDGTVDTNLDIVPLVPELP